jgi:lipopolysaccharide/colanic/teichoic acid biosynthesis glycosyltransferase
VWEVQHSRTGPASVRDRAGVPEDRPRAAGLCSRSWQRSTRSHDRGDSASRSGRSMCAVGLIGLVLLSPVFLVVMVAVRLSGPRTYPLMTCNLHVERALLRARRVNA